MYPKSLFFAHRITSFFTGYLYICYVVTIFVEKFNLSLHSCSGHQLQPCIIKLYGWLIYKLIDLLGKVRDPKLVTVPIMFEAEQV